MPSRKLSRRTVLSGYSASLAALAGCSALGLDDGDGATPTPTRTETESTTPTATPTPTVTPTPAFSLDWTVDPESDGEYEQTRAVYARDAEVVRVDGVVTATSEGEVKTVTWAGLS